MDRLDEFHGRSHTTVLAHGRDVTVGSLGACACVPARWTMDGGTRHVVATLIRTYYYAAPGVASPCLCRPRRSSGAPVRDEADPRPPGACTACLLSSPLLRPRKRESPLDRRSPSSDRSSRACLPPAVCPLGHCVVRGQSFSDPSPMDG